MTLCHITSCSYKGGEYIDISMCVCVWGVVALSLFSWVKKWGLFEFHKRISGMIMNIYVATWLLIYVVIRNSILPKWKLKNSCRKKNDKKSLWRIWLQRQLFLKEEISLNFWRISFFPFFFHHLWEWKTFALFQTLHQNYTE